MKYKQYYNYKNYTFSILTDDTCLLKLKLKKVSDEDAVIGINPVMQKVISQLDEYFAGKRKSFDLPVKIEGTDFQKRVWLNLSKIPYGETVSYKQLAEMSGNPKASRAVGMANNKNPVAIVVPCHRVIGSNGNLTGYAGGLTLKKELLELEKNNL